MTGEQAMAAVVKTGGSLVEPDIAARIVRFAAAAEPRLEGRQPDAPAAGATSVRSEFFGPSGSEDRTGAVEPHLHGPQR